MPAYEAAGLTPPPPAEMADRLGAKPQRFTVAQFKERFDLSRKWAIPLLEHFDSTGATRRLGDERQVVASS